MICVCKYIIFLVLEHLSKSLQYNCIATFFLKLNICTKPHADLSFLGFFLFYLWVTYASVKSAIKTYSLFTHLLFRELLIPQTLAGPWTMRVHHVNGGYIRHIYKGDLPEKGRAPSTFFCTSTSMPMSGEPVIFFSPGCAIKSYDMLSFISHSWINISCCSNDLLSPLRSMVSSALSNQTPFNHSSSQWCVTLSGWFNPPPFVTGKSPHRRELQRLSKETWD